MTTQVHWALLSLTGVGATIAMSTYGCGSTTAQNVGDAGTHVGQGGSGGTGGNSSTGGVSTGGAAGAGGGVVLCNSDKACTASGRLCDPRREICVECIADSDCGAKTSCVSGVCRSYVPCVNSRDCPTDQVCSGTLGRCVQCLANGDCPSADVCLAALCRTRCVSDKDCIAANQLCDKVHGYCTDCLQDADCGTGSHCDADSCVPNVCAPLSAVCLDDLLLTCDSHGSGYTSRTCASGCSQTGGAHCLGGAGGAGGAGTGGAGGGCAGGAPSETLTLSDCGTTGARTVKAYSGLVTVSVSGVEVMGPPPYIDAFYWVNATNETLPAGSCPQCIRYNRASEGYCLCQDSCPSHLMSGLLTQAYPSFSPTHVYTVEVNLGSAAPEQLDFGVGDCGCYDNSGSFTLTIAPVVTCTP